MAVLENPINILLMIFVCIKTTKHLDIRRDMKTFSPVGCCIDKRQNKIHRMIKREHLICFQTRLCPPLASLTATQGLLMDLIKFVNTA